MGGEVEPEGFEVGEGFDGWFGVEVGVKERGGVGAEPGFVFGVEFFIGAEDGFAVGFGHAVDAHGHELPELGSEELVVVSKDFGQGFGGRGADMADAHCCKEFGEPARFGSFDRGEHVLDLLLAHAIELDQLVAVVFEGVDIREVIQGDVRSSDQVNGRFAEGVDIHLASPDEPDEFLADLGGALGVHTPPGGFKGRVFDRFGRLDLEWGIAGWAVSWRKDWVGVGGAFFEDHADNLRDDFASFFDLDRIAKVEVALADDAVVVEGGVRDGGAGEEDGFKGGTGGDLAGLADLVIDREEFGGFALGGELVGDDPSGGFGGIAQGCLLGE